MYADHVWAKEIVRLKFTHILSNSKMCSVWVYLSDVNRPTGERLRKTWRFLAASMSVRIRRCVRCGHELVDCNISDEVNYAACLVVLKVKSCGYIHHLNTSARKRIDMLLLTAKRRAMLPISAISREFPWARAIAISTTEKTQRFCGRQMCIQQKPKDISSDWSRAKNWKAHSRLMLDAFRRPTFRTLIE